MRSFENRADCSVIDEPLYAAYLTATGIDHPGRDDVAASQSTDPAVVVAELTGGPLSTPVQYQKHMTHHLLPTFPRRELSSLRHALLIRDPERMLTSYAKVREEPTLEDFGLPQASQTNPSGSVKEPASLRKCDPLPSGETPASLASARRP